MVFFSKVGVILLMVLACSACSVFEFEQSARLCADDSGDFHPCIDKPSLAEPAQVDQINFTVEQHFVAVNDYTQQLAYALETDISKASLNGSIVVTPFTYGLLNGDQYRHLGHEVALYLTSDLNNLGVPTADSSLTKNFFRTANNEIEFSMEQLDWMTEFDVGYVLLGQMLPRGNGLVLNARVVELKTGKVIASGSRLLPQLVLRALL